MYLRIYRYIHNDIHYTIKKDNCDSITQAFFVLYHQYILVFFLVFKKIQIRNNFEGKGDPDLETNEGQSGAIDTKPLIRNAIWSADKCNL